MVVPLSEHVVSGSPAARSAQFPVFRVTSDSEFFGQGHDDGISNLVETFGSLARTQILVRMARESHVAPLCAPKTGAELSIMLRYKQFVDGMGASRPGKWFSQHLRCKTSTPR